MESNTDQPNNRRRVNHHHHPRHNRFSDNDNRQRKNFRGRNDKPNGGNRTSQVFWNSNNNESFSSEYHSPINSIPAVYREDFPNNGRVASRDFSNFTNRSTPEVDLQRPNSRRFNRRGPTCDDQYHQEPLPPTTQRYGPRNQNQRNQYDNRHRNQSRNHQIPPRLVRSRNTTNRMNGYEPQQQPEMCVQLNQLSLESTRHQSNSSSRNCSNRIRTRNNRIAKPNDEQVGCQREIMDDLLRKAQYECIVCCDMIQINQKTWNCLNCFNVFHLKCIQPWAKTSSINPTENSGENQPSRRRRNENEEWRCPTCQSIQRKYPNAYRCFCGKCRDPQFSTSYVPHSCGEICSRELSQFNLKNDDNPEDYFVCPHKCTLLCHPGKCAACTLKVERRCACSKTKTIVNCVSRREEIKCSEICGKLLNCKNHYCEKTCHFGDCKPCDQQLDVRCFCGKELQANAACGKQNELFSCRQKCGKKLSCSFHTCVEICHPGDCSPCLYDPELVKCCPCGKTHLSAIAGNEQRLLCTDPIPVCDKICNKKLSCGSATEPHYCQNKCHTGKCPPCPLQTIIRCECGANSQKIHCKEMISPNFKCKRRCNKKLHCGRHKCLNECCTDLDHLCFKTCGRKLECGQHTCDEPCHSYSCRPCPNVIWTEVFCNCGAQVLYPPLPCSTAKPACDKPCSRRHDCSHTPGHPCHDDPQCPPCTAFVERSCFGGHESIPNVMCFKKGVSCGKFCSKKLPCNVHLCSKICHEGECPPCNQKCTIPRKDCDHPCGLSCHQSVSKTCPPSKCKELVKVYCDCEVNFEQRECYLVNNSDELQRKIGCLVHEYFNTEFGLEEITKMARKSLTHSLKCDERCAKEKRRKELADAFGIDETTKAITWVKYPDMLKHKAQTNQQFLLTIHDQFVKLIEDFKKLNQKTLSYSFASMNRDNRSIIHGYAEYFCLKTKSVDKEPNRSVVVTADITSFVPPQSIFDAIGVKIASLRPNPSVVKYKLASEENQEKKKIDYFECDD